MFRAKLSILAIWVALAGLVVTFPTPGVAQTGGAGENVVSNGEFSLADPGSSSTALGWRGGRRILDGSDYLAEIVGPAGIMYQTLDRAKVALLFAQGKGLITITFEIVDPANRNSGLIVSLGGKLFNVDDYRKSSANPGKVLIEFRDDNFSLLGDRTLSFQLKRPGARVRLDDIAVSYSYLGGGEGGVEPTPTPNPQAFLPPGSLGQYAAVIPYGTPTPIPPSSLDTDGLRVTVNPPILYVSPGPTGAGLDGTTRAEINIELLRRDGTRVSADEVYARNAKLYVEFAGDKNTGSIIAQAVDDVQEITSAPEDLYKLLLGAMGGGTTSETIPRQLYFVPSQVQDAEVRLLFRVEIDMPRQGQSEDLRGKLELSRVVPISVRVKPGSAAKGNRALRGLAPLDRFNRIFVESSLTTE
ncbi:MAG: hypothetical protein ABIH23_04625 [bacterium]